MAVKRTAEGNLHFYINGVDQGVAARNVPARVYGVIDLYGQAAQASVVDHSGEPCLLFGPPPLPGPCHCSSFFQHLVPGICKEQIKFHNCKPDQQHGIQ